MDTDKAERSKPGKVGCLVIVVALAGVITAAGLLLGRKQEASATPCERFVATYIRALDNCSSGYTQNHAHHIAACEKAIDPTPECLEWIEELPCPKLDLGPEAVGGICSKK